MPNPTTGDNPCSIVPVGYSFAGKGRRDKADSKFHFEGNSNISVATISYIIDKIRTLLIFFVRLILYNPAIKLKSLNRENGGATMKSKGNNSDKLGFKAYLGTTLMGTTDALGAGVMSGLFMMYLTDYAGIGKWGAILGSALLMFARLFDAVNDPLEGWIMDRAKVGKYGKYRPFIFLSILMCFHRSTSCPRGGFLPFSGQFCGFQRIGHYLDKFRAFFRGEKLLFLPFHKAGAHQLFNHAGAGGRSAKPLALHVLQLGKILRAAVFHCGKQRVL